MIMLNNGKTLIDQNIESTILSKLQVFLETIHKEHPADTGGGGSAESGR